MSPLALQYVHSQVTGGTVSGIFQKLNLKNQHALVVLHAPASFEPELRALENVTVHHRASAVKKIEFALAFVTKQKQGDAFAQSLAKKAHGDAGLWFAYPKGTSKKYKCEVNRDYGWAALGKQGFDPVRQVAIDEDWSALRFRRVEFIKTMTRSFGMTKQGRANVEGKK